MRFITIIIIFILTLLLSCRKEESNMETSLMEASKQELADAIEERDRLIVLVKEISENIEDVKANESIYPFSNSIYNQKDSKDGIILDLNAIQKTLAQRRSNISSLERNIEISISKFDSLKNVVKALRWRLDSQSTTVAKLKKNIALDKASIDSLNKIVDSLNSEINEAHRQLQIASSSSLNFADRFNTCHFVIADKKDLKKHKIIESSFLRKTKVLENDFDISFFTSADKRTLTWIDLKDHDVKILTKHPKNSYVLTNANRKRLLHITNPEQFWSLTNFLVIQTN